MIFLYINLGVCLLMLLMFMLFVISTAHEFRRQYPNLKIPKTHWSKLIFSVLKICIASIIPIFNLIVLLVIIFKSEEVSEKTIREIYLKYHTEGEQK